MSEYQKVEIVRDEPSQAYSEEDLQKINNEEQSNDAPAETEVEEISRPEWLPEKFEAPEDLAQAYEQLQAEFTKSRQEPKEEGEDSSDSSFDFTPYTEEFANNGTLSDQSIRAIESKGIPREMIDGYVAGQKALADAEFQNIYNEVGGEESYNAIIEWAGDNLSEGEQAAFNKAVMEGTSDDTMFAIRGLALRYKSQGGAAQPLVQGDTSSYSSSNSFGSLAELTNAMKDPRYQKDPAYRREVESRLKVSNIL